MNRNFKLNNDEPKDEPQQIELTEYSRLDTSDGFSAAASSPVTKTNDEIQPHISKSLQEEIKVKDQGYAWIVLAAMFMNNILSTGYVKSFGVIYNAILDVYPKTSGVMSGVMMGLLVGCKTMFAPVAGAMANMIGIRRTMSFGCTLYVTALLASFFCTSPAQLAFTLGALAGFGQCIVDTCQVVVVSQYFESKLSLANGIRVAGNPCGGMVLPILLTALLEAYGLKLMFILVAGIMSHIYVCSFLMRPLDIHVRIKAMDYINSIQGSCAHDLEETSAICDANGTYAMNPTADAQKKELYFSILAKNDTFSSQKKKRKKPLDFSLLKNPLYLRFLLMAAIFPLSIPQFLFQSTIYAKTVVGLSAYDISFMLAFESIFDFFIRIFIGWLNNKKLYSLSVGFLCCMCCSALGAMLMPLANSLLGMMAIFLLYTLGPASFHTFINVMLCEKFGKGSIATTWGFLRMVQGVFSFVHPAFIGYVLDQTETYTVPFIIMGFGLFLCGLVIFLANPNSSDTSS